MTFLGTSDAMANDFERFSGDVLLLRKLSFFPRRRLRLSLRIGYTECENLFIK